MASNEWVKITFAEWHT